MEKKDYMNPEWLKYQYYELKRSIQDIANDQHVPMPTIWSKLEKLEKPILIKEELKPKTEVHPFKTEESKHMLSTSMEKVRKPLKECLNCGHQLSFSAKFCAICGEKVEGMQLEPQLQENEEEVLETEGPKIKIEEIEDYT